MNITTVYINNFIGDVVALVANNIDNGGKDTILVTSKHRHFVTLSKSNYPISVRKWVTMQLQQNAIQNGILMMG